MVRKPSASRLSWVVLQSVRRDRQRTQGRRPGDPVRHVDPGRIQSHSRSLVVRQTSVCRNLYREICSFRINDKLKFVGQKTKETVMSATDPLIHLSDVRKVFY